MKMRIATTLVALFAFSSLAFADIQASPGSQWNWSRKLSRGLANLAYGPMEIFSYWSRPNVTDGNVAASAIAPIEGLKRTLVRVGYGVFEVVTFPAPAYKAGYRPPYFKKQRIDPWFGYDEFAPQLGITSQASYSRTQVW
jgi:putative exosortase-associated protein (TIGR04073 family)